MLVPPDNFGLVEPGVYRCSKLDADNFPFLDTLQLKSLILLDAEKPPRTLRNYIETNKVELFNLGGLKITNHHHTGESSSTNKDNDEEDGASIHGDGLATGSISSNHGNNPDVIKKRKSDTIDVITLDTTNKNKNDQWMLIEKNLILGAFEILFNKTKHNLLLVDLTSTLVGILRKIQKWNLNSIVNEYRIYTGNSNKSNYYAQNFLELIQTELIPFEIDQLNHQIKRQQQREEHIQHRDSVCSGGPSSSYGTSPRSPSIQRTPSRNQSIDYGGSDDDKDDTRSIDDDDMDDDLLSASPQIPANLLKLVEMKKQEHLNEIMDNDSKKITPGTSPKFGKNGSRNDSVTNDLIITAARANMERRRSSIDSKFIRTHHHNKSFRNQNPNTLSPSQGNSLPHSQSSSFPTKWSFEKTPKYLGGNDSRAANANIYNSLTNNTLTTNNINTEKELRASRGEDLTSSEIQATKDKYDFKYYKNLNKYPTNYENVGIIKLKLPSDSNLPDWFIRSRNHWEFNFNKLNNL